MTDFALPATARLVDLNRGFRDFLTSPSFLRDLSVEVHERLDAFERRRALRGADRWPYYCDVRLAALLAVKPAARVEGEWLDEYVHALATGEGWYFTNHRAHPVPAASPPANELDRIGPRFAAYVARCGLLETAGRASKIVVTISADGELPFARLLVGLLKKDAPAASIEISTGGGKIEPVLSRMQLADAARYFRRSPGRLLSVRWRPRAGAARGPKIKHYVEKLRSYGIPLALELAPRIDTGSAAEDALFGDVLDGALGLQSFVDDITVAASGHEALSDLLYVQLVAELDDVRLAPWRARRTATDADSKLRAAPAHVVRSSFDLAALSASLSPDKDGHWYRLGRGHATAGGPGVRRSARASRYLVFAGCPQIIPMTRADSAYADAIAFFARPRRARAFIDHYRGEAPSDVLAFLDLLVHNDILRPA